MKRIEARTRIEAAHAEAHGLGPVLVAVALLALIAILLMAAGARAQTLVHGSADVAAASTALAYGAEAPSGAAPAISAEPSSAAPSGATASLAERDPLLIDGERLTYDIYYGAIPAGEASLEVKSEATASGDIFRITSRARSNDVVSIFYEVDDRVVAEIDARTFEPRRFEKHISEGSLKKSVSIHYDDDGLVRAGAETFRVEPGTRDILSALYYLRGQDLRVGEDVIVRTFENGKCYQARVRVLGREKVSTRRGEFDCLVVEPEIVEGVFAKAGRLVIYLTDDALRLPVLLKSKVKIGSFVAELVGRTS
jgi:hypothetical protein